MPKQPKKSGLKYFQTLVPNVVDNIYVKNRSNLF